MKFLLTTIILIVLSSCSFDSKSGIWKNSNKKISNKEDQFKDFETLYTSTKLFNSIIAPNNDLKIILDPVTQNQKWIDEYYNTTNNLDNFSYKDLDEIIFKSKRLKLKKTNVRLLYDKQKVIINDIDGNIIIYSLENQKIFFKYNFYKKEYKKIKKKLKVIIEKNIIYIADNLGYVYAIDLLSQKLLWAKDYKIPFRSNLKIIENKLVLADINNALYFLNKNDGEKIKILPTEEVLMKNDFINSLALDKKSLFYLNTYGSLYSLSLSGKIKWFVNLNQSIDISPNSLFYSKPISIHQDKIIISTGSYLYMLNKNNGSILSKLPISSLLNSIISGKNIFLITPDNLLVCIELDSGKILYSIDINQSIATYLDIKKKSATIRSIALVNNELFIFLNNSYLVKFQAIGKIRNIVKLSSDFNSLPIFINDSLIYLNDKNKLIITN